MSSAEVQKPQGSASDRLRRWRWSLVIAVLVAISVTVATWLSYSARSIQGVTAGPAAGGREASTSLDMFGNVPGFSLTERSGRTVTTADLAGKVWIVDFIYTRCTDACPLQSAHMARLQADLGGRQDAGLLSISVDPAYDTPRVLAKYAARFHADHDRWLFLTGSRATIARLAGEGFHLGLVTASAERSGARIRLAHSSRFALVDRHARIRGYYDGTDWDALARLRSDVARLAAGG